MLQSKANNSITVIRIMIKTQQPKISILNVDCGPRSRFWHQNEMSIACRLLTGCAILLKESDSRH